MERESFNYGHFNENSNSIRKNNDLKNKEQLIIEKEIGDTDIPKCKNKANVYKSRGKTISHNVIHTDKGISVKIPNID